MKRSEFNKLAKAKNLTPGTKTFEACFLVLVKGETPSNAAKLTGMNRSSVTRPLARLMAEVPVCKCCGRPL